MSFDEATLRLLFDLLHKVVVFLLLFLLLVRSYHVERRLRRALACANRKIANCQIRHETPDLIDSLRQQEAASDRADSEFRPL